MNLAIADILILTAFLIGIVVVGFVAERMTSDGLKSYFLGNNRVAWWMLAASNAASMFDISGTIWLVSLLYVYGLKSVFLPWLWPIFNQIFLMIYLAAWLRRSGAMTGGEWIQIRFGRDGGADLSRLTVVVFALLGVIASVGYAFVGLSKFSAVLLPPTIPGWGYALLIVGATTAYTVAGGFYSVVLTDIVQLLLLVGCSVAVGLLAICTVTPETIASAVPDGWGEIWFSWRLSLDWSTLNPAAQAKLEEDGYVVFGAFFMMLLLKGVVVSLAGPAPNNDMQRVLAARSDKEAAMMSGLVTVIMFLPRYLLVAGLTVLALHLPTAQLADSGTLDTELLMPMVIRELVPPGLTGLLIAGLLAAFMSTFAGKINAAAAYLVRDIYQRYVHQHANEARLVRVSRAASLLVPLLGCLAGLMTPTVHFATDWIVSALWGGYAAPNLLKWHWWRLNGYGYFAGMTAGIVGSMAVLLVRDISPLQLFPALSALSATASIVVSLCTPAPAMDVLATFYRRTRPWGFWGPVRRQVLSTDASFHTTSRFARDITNVAVGIIWQLGFIAAPIYLVLRDWVSLLAAIATLVITSVFLKRSWYDHLTDTTSASLPPATASDQRLASSHEE